MSQEIQVFKYIIPQIGIATYSNSGKGTSESPSLVAVDIL